MCVCVCVCVCVCEGVCVGEGVCVCVWEGGVELQLRYCYFHQI